MKKTFFASIFTILLLLPALTFGQAAAAKPKSPARNAAENITQAQLKDYLYYVASDEMEGRDTPSRGLDLTAKFLALQLSRWGFKPAGDNGTFFQTMELTRYTTDQTATSLQIAGKDLAYGTDFVALPQAGAASNAPLVFAGNGWYIKSKNIDPYNGIDVAGKIVVVYSDQLPRGINNFRELSALGRQGEDWMSPTVYAIKKGAAGVIYINTPDLQKNFAQLRAGRERGSMEPEKLREASNSFPIMYLTQQAAENLFAGESTTLASISEAYRKADAAMPSFNFANKSGSMKVVAAKESTPTQNVVATFEGEDPALKKEMVAVGAHYDHVGINPNLPGPDKLRNGADDDGSGTVAVLAIAEALAKSPKKPKRSILLVWHCGEEKGLWGSEYFNKFPTVDIKNVVAQLNIDMIGRSLDPANVIKCEPRSNRPCNENLTGSNGVYVIGSEMMSSTLGAITKDINKAYLNLNYDYKYDDPKDPNRFFFRSDHFNYAVNGIPIAFWFDGVHEDYHGVGDHADKIDYVKLEKVTRTIFLTMWEIADLKDRPKIDKQLPAELTQR